MARLGPSFTRIHRAARGARSSRLALAAVFICGALPVALNPGMAGTLAAGPDPSKQGQFETAFTEPGADCPTNQDGLKACKPTAASVVALADGRVLYWNGLEGTENVAFNTVAEYGDVAVNDQSRVLDLRGHTPSWINTGDGGAPAAKPNYLIPGVTSGGADPNRNNDGAMFCSDQVQLADGRILDVGGTSYYDEPQIPGTRYGVAELQGLKAARIFDPATNTWSQSGSMTYGRWYPSLVTLPNGNVFVASGVSKLIKPVYLDNVNDSGRNVTETETYSPLTGQWTYNGTSANKSLPLFPRLHLLPDGKVYYDAAGQTFNPDGQAYDEVTWNMASVYDPAAKSWNDVGIPGLGTLTPGFRGSGFSVALPLTAPYKSASFLSAGGVLGTSPGTYLATNTSEINTIDTAHGDAMTSNGAGNLNNARWYSTGVVLPDGSVMAFSGGDKDEVVLPGTEKAITQAERFDPVTKTWSPMASAVHQRTYHNTAILLATGQVLVGGHAPIPTGYGYNQTLPGFAPSERDPSFEIYDPPYMFNHDRPVIDETPSSTNYGDTIKVVMHNAAQAAAVDSVRLVRFGALTHLVDGDQRQLVLPIVERDGANVFVTAPPNSAVAPAGPYMLFADTKPGSELIPSKAATVFVGHEQPNWVELPPAASPVPPPAPTPSPNPVPSPLIGPLPPLPPLPPL